jgi:hypothetical protein
LSTVNLADRYEEDLAAGSVAFTADGSRLFAITVWSGLGNQIPVQLHVITP